MVRRKTAVVDNRPTDVILPDSEWMAEKYREFSSRFFSIHKVPDVDSGIIGLSISGRMKRSWGMAYFYGSRCGGACKCKVEEAPSPKPSHVGRNVPGFVWIRGRSVGEPRMAIRMSGKSFLPERVWEGVLVHEMVHIACYWNGLWTGEGHDGWFVDISDEIRDASGGEFDIQRFIGREEMLARDDIEAESYVPGEDYGFAVEARLGMNGVQFHDNETAGKSDPVLCIHGWRGINTVLWRCASLDDAKRGITALRDSFRQPFSVGPGDRPPMLSVDGSKFKFMPRVVGFAIYEMKRDNVSDRSKRKAVRREFQKLARLPDSFPTPLPSKQEIYDGQAVLSRAKSSGSGVAVKIWDSNGGWTEAYRNRGRTGVEESFVAKAAAGIASAARSLVSGFAGLVRSVLGSLWGKPEVVDHGDGFVDVAIP